MYRLPLPNWNAPPNHVNGDFSMQNMAVPPRGPFAPFMPGLSPGMSYSRPMNQAVLPTAVALHEGSFINNQQFHQGQQQHHKNNIEHNRGKDRSREKTVQEYSCDVCERFFNTKQILDTHLATHVECEQEGCTFQASRKVLKLHFIQNHAEGRMRIVLETPKQIQKWREERKKKYPTVANVEKKLAEEKEKREMGQVAQNRTYRYRGKNQKFQNHQNRHPNHQRNHRKFTNQNEKVHCENQDQNSHNSYQTETKTETSEKRCQSQDGDPLSLVLLNEEDGHKDSCDVGNAEESSEVQTSDCTPVTIDNTSALMSLCASYGDMSSDEEDSIPNAEVNNNNLKEDKLSCNKKEDTPKVKENIVTKPLNSSPRKRKRTGEQGPQRNMKKQANKRLTLLEKLLAPEIRHESNVILQCIRYIVKKNYFDVVAQENNDALPSA